MNHLRYLQTGDGWYLKHTFPGESGYQEFFTSWDKLYHYNKDLPDSGKLIVHGLDFEREPGLSASLYTLLSKYASNLEVERLRNTIKARLDTIGIERDTKEFILYLREKIPAISLPPDANKKVMDDIINNESFVSRLDKRDSLMAETFVAIDTTNEIYLGQFGLAHTMLNSSRGLGKLLNSHEKYHNKILVTNMFYVDTSNDNYPFKNLSDCPVFLYRIDPQDQQYGGFAKRGQWTLILKDQPNYTTVKKDLK